MLHALILQDFMQHVIYTILQNNDGHMGTYAMDCSRHLFEFYNETEKNTEVYRLLADFMRGRANIYVIRYSLQGKHSTELVLNTLQHRCKQNFDFNFFNNKASKSMKLSAYIQKVPIFLSDLQKHNSSRDRDPVPFNYSSSRP
jgi:hypothetical protein